MIAILPVPADVSLNQPWNHCERRDENDIPAECPIGQRFIPDEPYNESEDEDFSCELHELYTHGSVRFRHKA